MVTLTVKELAKNFSNDNKAGEILFEQLKSYFNTDTVVTVSFAGISEVSSSFVNSAFINLLSCYDFNYIKSRLKIVNSTKQINDLIKQRFSFEVSRQITV
ncbi:STAS-like domain-containing protein [Streptococcus dysgalactiae]|uniref:STAS-like domain-containing protein n=1 Tax=Streptococcus dysgalactiae TaxID=1334 RepID=UPI001CF480EA|nr:STAS-like domain-containing protein [Streptococcus dysgalactiae]MCB2829991.1 STAS-like domain-containing protein [Streptococcus dysgalactiae subsp. dysgalactiae]MCB2843990.1 STAS-like domain-containing protein [Streptococcus dysgalactiae subsp. dysgalactiae]MCB2851052.1 STAS-like domain-containing protein [Streptococcus dysgalactiae subsp. dysgalactiae]